MSVSVGVRPLCVRLAARARITAIVILPPLLLPLPLPLPLPLLLLLPLPLPIPLPLPLLLPLPLPLESRRRLSVAVWKYVIRLMFNVTNAVSTQNGG